jgi:acetyl-CoA carboxylase biotin carboxyl carrier protein
MNLKELKELIEYLKQQDITEFELERGDVKVRIKRGTEHVVSVVSPGVPYATVTAPVSAAPAAQGPAIPSAAPTAKETPAATDDGTHMVKSPIVGTFYESPSPGSPPFIKIGDVVEVGQVLCIVEAMKLMNEIESDVAGEVIKKLVNNGQPIEYGQELFAIRPK